MVVNKKVLLYKSTYVNAERRSIAQSGPLYNTRQIAAKWSVFAGLSDLCFRRLRASVPRASGWLFDEAVMVHQT
jgi:hypothetical protein